MINVPNLGIYARKDVSRMLPDPDQVDVHMLGEITGKTLLVFHHDSARRLAGMLTRRTPEENVMSVLERSAIQEVGTILAPAYLNALSEIVGGALMPTPPVVDSGPGAEVVGTAAMRGPGSDPVLTINTRFDIAGVEEIEGTFLVLPDHDSLARILEALRVR